MSALIEHCELPTFLAARKYADFTGNYERGLRKVVDGVIPDLTLWTALKWIAEEFEALIGVIEKSTDGLRSPGLATLDMLLSHAYRSAIR